MWRTIIINDAHRLSVKEGWLVIGDYTEHRVPLEEIYSLIIDNPAAIISVSALNALTQHGIHVLCCGNKHLPESLILPYNTHYRPLTVIRKQLSWSKEFCDKIWQKIIISKIENQACVLKICGCGDKAYNYLTSFAKEVQNGDTTNREGLAAKVFFRDLYGSSFVRMGDDALNHALNYGYAIIRSAVAKTLCAYGFNPVIGIHHISETNPYNLADDLMEPLRPIVDLWVDLNHEDLFEELTRDNKRKLVNLINEVIYMDGKKMRVRNAIDKYINTFAGSVYNNNTNSFKTPAIIKETLDEMRRGEVDD
jgi:CRISPR-associated protein Cas1